LGKGEFEGKQLFSKGFSPSKIPFDLKTCPICKEAPDYFKPHDCRKRVFLVIVEWVVQKIESVLGRWKCPLCNHTFTYYPNFAIPYKRYVKDNILTQVSHFKETNVGILRFYRILDTTLYINLHI